MKWTRVLCVACVTSMDAGYDAGYDTGYDAGYDARYDAGYDAGYTGTRLVLRALAAPIADVTITLDSCTATCSDISTPTSSRASLAVVALV